MDRAHYDQRTCQAEEEEDGLIMSRRTVRRSPIAGTGGRTKFSGCDRETRAILQAVDEASGWRVELTGGEHYKIYPPDPDKPAIVTGKTASDWRGLRNLKARLKRDGLIV